jgi:hypothetical protein
MEMSDNTASFALVDLLFVNIPSFAKVKVIDNQSTFGFAGGYVKYMLQKQPMLYRELAQFFLQHRGIWSISIISRPGNAGQTAACWAAEPLQVLELAI